MTKQFFVYAAALAIGICSVGDVNAQKKDTASVGKDLERAGLKATRAIEKTANKVGNKTAEIASKGKSEVVDKVYAGKKGPNGEKVFIDGKSKYYIVDKKGRKQYIDKSKLVDSPE
ncbi:MAG: hypothetical protein ABI151_02995 [Chitinophagaceae bacterium]